MRAPGEIWRQRPWIWVPALLFFLANAGAFAVYNLGYAGRVETLDEQLKAQEQELQDLADKRQQKEAMKASVRTNEQLVERLYAERLPTRRQALTAINAEVKNLARQAGLVPKAIHYEEEEIQEYGLIKRSFTFPVQGTYAELRKLISLLETSKSFLSLDEITVAGNAEGPELRVELSLSTLFASEDAEAGLAPVGVATAAVRPEGTP